MGFFVAVVMIHEANVELKRLFVEFIGRHVQGFPGNGDLHEPALVTIFDYEARPVECPDELRLRHFLAGNDALLYGLVPLDREVHLRRMFMWIAMSGIVDG